MTKLKNLLRSVKLKFASKKLLQQSAPHETDLASIEDVNRVLNNYHRLFKLYERETSKTRSAEINKVKSSIRYYLKKHSAHRMIDSISHHAETTEFTIKVIDELKDLI